MRLGIFGGTFDPPHVGHLLAASDACEALELDQLLFIPASVQPFKGCQVEASPLERLRMLELMVAGDPRFAADPVEIDRNGLSFTVETLETLAARQPGARRFLLIGEDLSRQITTWKDSRRIAELAEIIVLTRGGWADDTEASGHRVPGELALTRIATRRVDVSSTEIRARVLAGKSIHGFVTEAVAAFIESAGLYRHRGTTC
ncbi:MAG TPA: nicotinate-nucleotide adenylyltransferase [Gemmatimonadaceae bacterium]